MIHGLLSLSGLLHTTFKYTHGRSMYAKMDLKHISFKQKVTRPLMESVVNELTILYTFANSGQTSLSFNSLFEIFCFYVSACYMGIGDVEIHVDFTFISIE